ncbi:MAG: TonB-dependent receptor, partial [Acidobacteriota bacterium]|nr:TonB-dependent receptor [Acidobacteriota bacterium]
DVGQFGGITHNNQLLAGIGYTHLFSATWINEARIGFTRTNENDLGAHHGRDFASEIGITGVTQDPHLVGFPRFTVSGLVAIGDQVTQPSEFAVNNFEWADTATLVRGKHLIKFGADVLRTQFFQSFNDNNRGTFNFLGRLTNSPLADLLLGLPETSTRQIGTTPAYLFSTNYGLFVQDDYKIASRLTINLGLRYELIKPPVEKYGRIASFVPAIDEVIIADSRTVPDLAERLAAVSLTGKVDVARNRGLPQSLVYTNYRNFGPRVGFAWRPFGGSRTVIRAGYGIFYGSTLQNPIRNDLANVYPFTESQTFTRPTNNPGFLNLSNPYPDSRAGFTNILNANGYEKNAPAPYMQGYNFTVDREIGGSTVIEAAYVGSRGVHLGRRYDINQPFRSANVKVFPRPYSGFNTINYYSFGSSSNYNSAQFSLRRRFRRGLFYDFNYGYSKSIDDASQVSGNATGGYPGAQDSRNLKLERGRSDFDVRHAFTMNWSWETPWQRNMLVRGWQLAGTGRAYSGAPFTPRVANVNLTLGEANRPDRIANGAVAHPTVDRWFDTSAFPLVPTGAFRFGNSGRNILNGPGLIAFNVSLFRNFAVTESSSVQFRAEAFNVLNHPNFHLPNDNVDTLAGGTIRIADPGRQIQFGARYRF